MSLQTYPALYTLLNNLQTKNLNIVVQVDGYDQFFSVVPTFKKLRYGDPYLYGDPVVYGGLVPVENNRAYLSLDSTIVIQQRLEPEQGRSSVSTMSLSFIDKDGYMSKFISPKIILPEVLGKRLVKVWFGYQNSSFPDDYFVIFRGFISETKMMPTKVVWQLSDANSITRQDNFSGGKTKLAANISGGDTTITVAKTDGFHIPILGPDGTYDTNLKTYIKIGDEYMQYFGGTTTGTTFTVVRGARGTTSVAHNIGDDVENSIEISGNCLDVARKIMLSGFAGAWKTGVIAKSFVYTLDPILGNISNTILLPNGVNAVEDYGLDVGEYITISGGANNGITVRVTDFGSASGYNNNLIYVSQDLTPEFPTVSILSFRSEFDTLPITCGSKVNPTLVDLAIFRRAKLLFFGQADNNVRIFQKDSIGGKEFIEKELYLPFGGYGVTRFGKLSFAVTKPPIANERLTYLDNTNVIDPQSIVVTRGINNRRFFDIVKYEFDIDDNDKFRNVFDLIDSDGINLIGSSTLPIQARGIRSDLGAVSMINRRGQATLSRFKNAAYEIDLKVNFKAASLIEITDVIALKDNGTLQITNLETGSRDLGTQLYEVIDRKLDVKTGSAQLKLLSTLGYKINDRYATIAPSSYTSIGSSTVQLVIKDSFGSLYPLNEKRKWEGLEGSKIVVHSYDWTFSEEVTFLNFDPANKYLMNIDPPLSISPPANYIVDLTKYPNNTDQLDQETSKLLFDFLTPTVDVLTGISQLQFTVSAGDIGKFSINQPILIHNQDYSIFSAECIVDTIIGTTITLKTALGFVPTVGEKVELIGYIDGGGPYRIL